MHMLFFAGSLRADSYNKKYAREALRLAKEAGAQGEFLDLRDYAMPIYDGDIETQSGIPETTKQLSAKIKAADALVISAPEYNGSITGVLKNTLDWLSREKPVSIAGKHVLLIGASPGALGGVRGLWQTRMPFEVLGAHVYPTVMGLPKADAAFDENGRLKDEKTAQQLGKLVGSFLQHVKGKAA